MGTKDDGGRAQEKPLRLFWVAMISDGLGRTWPGSTQKLGRQVDDFSDVLRVARSLMYDSCEWQFARSVSRQASAAMASWSTFSDEKFDSRKCILGASWTKDLMSAASSRGERGSLKGGSANRTTCRPATKLLKRLREVRNAVGRGVDVDSSSWRACTKIDGLTGEASRHGWDETVTKPQDRSISNPPHLSETEWDFMGNALLNEEQKQLPPKLRVAATAEEPTASAAQGGGLAFFRLNPSSTRELADVIAGRPAGDTQMGEASREAAHDVGL